MTSARPLPKIDLLSCYAGHADRITAEITPLFRGLASGDRASTEWYAFQTALRAFGPASAPAVPRLLASPLRDWSAVTLGRISPAAAEALPVLRAAAVGDDPRLAAAAAGVLWRIDRSPEALPLLTAHLDGPAATTAFEEIATMSSAAAPALHWWRRTSTRRHNSTGGHRRAPLSRYGRSPARPNG